MTFDNHLPKKGICLYQPFPSLIMLVEKTFETRYWPTKFRGKLLIAASKKAYTADEISFLLGELNPRFNKVRKQALYDIFLPISRALCVVTVTDCRMMQPEDVQGSFVPYDPYRWVWKLEDVKPVEPFEFKGRQGLFNLSDEEIGKIQWKH